MNSKERMFHSIEHTINDIAVMQDIVIKLTREIHELHVAKEHETKIATMKEQVGVLSSKLQTMQDFLYSCEHPTQHQEHRLTEVDVAS
ncbi:MAG: hypothetical protein Q8L88_03760 [Bacteroidota bacterium]|nr:hypothetical protein [Bacteroidota bacterium]